MRRLGKILFWLTWPGIWLVVHRSRRSRVIIMTPDKQVLLVKGWLSAGQWILPGGGLHRDEEAVDGAIREVSEETSIRLSADQLKLVEQTRMSDHGLSFSGEVFVAKLDSKPSLAMQKYEVSDLAWLDLNELKNVSPLTVKLLDKWAK